MKGATKRLHLTYRGLWYQALRQVGITGMLGFTLLALAMFALSLPVSRWRDDATELQRENQQLMRKFTRDQSVKPSKPKLDEQLKRFITWFPNVRRNASDLRLIVEQAARIGLDLDKGEYRVLSTAGTGFVSYEVVLPVKAEYADVRRFIGGVLNVVPNAALSELRMERPSANNNVLDVRVHFTLVYRGA